MGIAKVIMCHRPAHQRRLSQRARATVVGINHNWCAATQADRDCVYRLTLATAKSCLPSPLKSPMATE